MGNSNTSAMAATVRKSATYENASDQFRYPTEREFTQQFAGLYFARLETLRPRIVQEAKRVGMSAPIQERLISTPEGEERLVVVTLFKEMKLKPSALREYTAGRGIEAAEKLLSYCSDDDRVWLEDMSGRVALRSNNVLASAGVVTGLVCGIQGTMEAGEFVATHLCWPSIRPAAPLPALAETKYVAILSGLQLGGTEGSMLNTQMMVQYITGHLGSPEEVSRAASICRVIVAGNSLCSVSDAQLQPKTANQGTTDIAAAAVGLDQIMLALCSSVPVDIMAGASDPSDFAMPQQPLSRCLFPQSSTLQSLSAVTNPYSCQIDGVSFHGTSGQPIDHLHSFTQTPEGESCDRLDLMENCLRWRSCVPTAPETTACYPFKETDPFLLSEAPHVLFAGNQPEFGDRMFEGTRIIQVPSFSSTGSIVLINLANLECECLSFKH